MARKSFIQQIENQLSSVNWQDLKSDIELFENSKDTDSRIRIIKSFLNKVDNSIDGSFLSKLVLMNRFYNEIIDILFYAEQTDEDNFQETNKAILQKMSRLKIILELMEKE